MDHLPPPPYSETDMLSTTDSLSHIIPTPATSQADGVSAVHRYPPLSSASSTDEPAYTPLPSPSPSDHHLEDSRSFTSSAAAYFDSRPLQRRVPGEPEIYTIHLDARTRPEDIPYPSHLVLLKDIKNEDWQTFINYLIPDHITDANYVVANRKLQAGLIDEQMHQLTIGDEERSQRGLSHVEAQPGPLRQYSTSKTSTSASSVAATIAEWNQSFFVPRGVRIIVNNHSSPSSAEANNSRKPEAWIASDQELLPRTSLGGMKTFHDSDAHSKGFRMGPIAADSDGFRIGKGLVADNRGFRMGNMLVADHNGFRFGGHRGFVANSTGVTMGGRAFGRRGSHDSQGQNQNRGRYQHHHDHHSKPRKRSISSSSTSSSSSSSSSSSVGSLPEYKDLRDQQLPIARQALVDWLNHPDLVITKKVVKDIKQEIKAAKQNNLDQSSQDHAALKREVKELVKKFKESIKAQKRQRRILKKEKRAERKIQNRERRQAKREERRAVREERKHNRKGFEPPPLVPGGYPVVQHPGRGGFSSRGTTTVAFSEDISIPPVSRGPPAPHDTWFARTSHGHHSQSNYPQATFPNQPPFTISAEEVHAQIIQFKVMAESKEARAVELHVAATLDGPTEKDKLKMIGEAAELEEEANRYRRESERLRAEATLLDANLARELEDENGIGSGKGKQVCGITHG